MVSWSAPSYPDARENALRAIHYKNLGDEAGVHFAHPGLRMIPDMAGAYGVRIPSVMKLFHTFLLTTLLTGVVMAEDKAVDNTATNERDRSGETKTPFDQSEDPADVEITAGIRRAIMQDDSLSALAKNVKVITSAGKVVLRGPVNSTEEKSRIAKLAQVAGVKNVTNQLEVK